MILFNDEEDDEDDVPASPLRRWTKRLFLAALLLFVFSWVTLRILMSLGGNSDEMREAVQQLFQRGTGLHAAIGRFNYVKFYPDVGVDVSNVNLSETEHAPAMITIGDFKLSANFWSVLYPNGEIRDLNVEKFDIEEGYYFQKALDINKLALEKTGGPGGKPALVIDGAYGGDKFDGFLVMDWQDDNSKKGYFVRPKDSPFSLKSPFLAIDGELKNHPDGGLDFVISHLGFPDPKLSGSIFVRRDGDTYVIKGDLKGSGSEFVPDLTWTAAKGYTGTLHMPVFDTADAGIFKAIADFYDLLYAPAQPGTAGKLKTDITVSIDELRINHAKAGQLSFPVKIDGGVVNIGPLKGAVSGGEASGQATLDESKKNSSLTIKALVRDMKYGELQKALFGKESASGKATLDVSLASEAATTADLIKNLKGEAAFVAAEGDLSAGMLDLWGKSLIETMLPSFGHTETMKLNCMIADFKFADGLATADPLFLDSDDMTIAGEGNVTLSNDPQIDLLLTPKPKSPVLLSTAVNARIKGPLTNPDIGPDNLSLGKKAGGLLLGVVNPAFLVFSLTDLGLNDQHPCHKFIGAKP